MINWKPLEWEDRDLITKTLIECPLPFSDYPFTNLWMWNEHRSYHLAKIEKFICLRFQEMGQEYFLYPLGQGFRSKVIELMYKEQNIRNIPFKMRAIPEEGIEEFNTLSFPHRVLTEENRFDYVYRFEDLLHLRGNRYQAKRNLIYQFERNYPYIYQEITKDLIPKIQAMEEKWFKMHSSIHTSLKPEHEAVMRALKDFSSLNIFGGALIVENEVIAYSFGEYLGSVIFLIHVEKAFTDFKGAYQTINQQFLKHIKPTLYVNREENLGLPNLAKAKESYHPLLIFKKFILV